MRRKAVLLTVLATGGATFIQAAQSLLLTPIFVSKIGKELYGAWLSSGDILNWLLVFDFGLSSLLITKTAKYSANGAYRKLSRHFVVVVALLAILATSIAILGYCAAPYTATWFGLSDASTSALTFSLRLASASTALTLLSYSHVAVSRALQDTGIVNMSQIAGAVSSFGVTYISLENGAGLMSAPYGMLARGGVITIMGWVFVFLKFKSLGIGINSPKPYLFGYYIRKIPTSFAPNFAQTINNSIDNLIVGLFLGANAVVEYNVTKRAADLIKSMLDIATTSTSGAIASLSTSSKPSKIHRALGELLAIREALAILAVSLYIILNESFVTVWMGPEYYTGILLTILFGLSTHFSTKNYFYLNTLRFIGEMRFVAKLSIVESVAKLVVTFSIVALMGTSGAYGAPIASLTVAGCTFMLLRKRLVASFMPSHELLGAGFIKISIVTIVICMTLAIAGMSLGLDSAWQLYSPAIVGLLAWSFFAIQRIRSASLTRKA